MDAPRAAYQGAKQVAGAIISSTLTTICVFLPMIFTTGFVRQLMLPMALTITFSLVASLLVALTLVPTLGAVTLKKMKPKSYPVFDKLRDGYAVVLAFFLKVKIIPIAIAIGLMIFSGLKVVSMGVSLFPEMYADVLQGKAEMPEDITDEEAFELAGKVSEIMLANEGVETVGVMDSASESSIIANTNQQSDFSEFTYQIIPKEDVNTVGEVKQLIKELEEATADLECEVTLESSAMGEITQMMGNGLSVEVAGDDYEKLIALSEDVIEQTKDVEGVVSADNGQEDADAGLHLKIDRNKAMKKGITVAQIYQEISKKLTTSADATTVTLDNENMTVEVINETDKLLKDDLLDMTLEVEKQKENGETVTKEYKLSQFAELEDAISVSSMLRKNSERYVAVNYELEDGYNTTLVSREVQKIIDTMDVEKGYEITVGGEAETNADMVRQLVKLMILGGILIYLIMVAQFQSLLSPFIVIFTVPLAFTGGFIGLIIAHEQITLVALVGFLVLMGTVVNNGIVFVDYANQLRLGGVPKREALIATGKTRMRPILMTALTTVLAMVPLVVIQDVGNSMSKGMAIVIIGGMLYATLMTLFIIPVMYDILFRREPKIIDVGDESMDDVPDDAGEFLEEMKHIK